MSRPIPAGVVVALLVGALLACSRSGGDGASDEHDDNNFRPDVLECEDSLDRLVKCCPDFDAAPILCDFHFDQTSGCGSSSTDSVKPAFTEDESACIRATSCDALVSSGVCTRAQSARAYTYSLTTNTPLSLTDDAAVPATTGSSSSHPRVCP